MRGITARTGKKIKREIEMASPSPPRERLKALIERSGMSQRKLARDLGYSSTAGLNRYIGAEQGDKPVPYDIIKRIIPFLRGAGNPPITSEELLACSDVAAIPKPVVRAFEAVVDDGDGLVSVRYRIEPGVFVRPDTDRVLGASRVGVAKEYPSAAQFVAVVALESLDGVFRAGDNLHCVQPQAYHGELVGRRVVFGTIEGALMEVRAGTVTAKKGDTPVIEDDTGSHTGARVLGVVVGVYRRE